jgi:hypothetical protein
MNTPTSTEAGFDLDKPILTQSAFEEIAASWDGCEGEGIKDIGAALRQDFERLARPQVRQVGLEDEQLITQDWMAYCTIQRQAGKEPTDAQGDAFEFAWNVATAALARRAAPATSAQPDTTAMQDLLNGKGWFAPWCRPCAALPVQAGEAVELAPLPNTELAYRLADYANGGYSWDEYAKVMREASDAIHAVAKWNECRASLAPVSAQPDYKWVPLEPTDAMLRAAFRLDLSYMPGQESADREAIYRAMVAAAPVSAQQGAADPYGLSERELRELHRILTILGVSGAETLDSVTSMACFWSLIHQLVLMLEGAAKAPAAQALPESLPDDVLRYAMECAKLNNPEGARTIKSLWRFIREALNHPAPPNCGACPGDGSICKTECRLAAESPPVPAAQAVDARTLYARQCDLDFQSRTRCVMMSWTAEGEWCVPFLASSASAPEAMTDRMKELETLLANAEAEIRDLDAAHAQQPAAPRVSDTWQWVPKVPAQEMIDNIAAFVDGRENDAEIIYRAMIAAAPATAGAAPAEPITKADLWDAIHQYVSDYGDQFRTPPTTGADKRCNASRDDLAAVIDKLYADLSAGAATTSNDVRDAALLNEVADVLAENNWRGDLVEALRAMSAHQAKKTEGA